MKRCRPRITITSSLWSRDSPSSRPSQASTCVRARLRVRSHALHPPRRHSTTRTATLNLRPTMGPDARQTLRIVQDVDGRYLLSCAHPARWAAVSGRSAVFSSSRPLLPLLPRPSAPLFHSSAPLPVLPPFCSSVDRLSSHVVATKRQHLCSVRPTPPLLLPPPSLAHPLLVSSIPFPSPPYPLQTPQPSSLCVVFALPPCTAPRYNSIPEDRGPRLRVHVLGSCGARTSCRGVVPVPVRVRLSVVETVNLNLLL